MRPTDAQPRILSADQLNAALHEVGGSARKDYLADIVAQAGRTRQRPAWTHPERWLPMTMALRPAAIPRAVIYLALLALLLALLGGTYLLFGASPSVRTVTPLVQNGLIAFQSGRDIDVVEPDGTGLRTLIPGAGESSFPSWSPDGDRLAYWQQAAGAGGWDVVVVDADGTHPVDVATGLAQATSTLPAWSPDGTRIAFSARTRSTGIGQCPGDGSQNGDFCSSRIFIADASGSGARQVGDATLDARSPSWSPDGSTIAFGGGNATPTVGAHLYLMDADGGHVRQVSEVRGTDWAFVVQDWSLDGSRIVTQASSAADLNEWDIWVIEADGSAQTDVGPHVGDELIPSWAPDRDALTWAWNDHIVVLEPGAEPVDLPAPGLPTWSPDGRLIAYASDAGIVVMGLDGTVQVTVPAAASDHVSWQPLSSAS